MDRLKPLMDLQQELANEEKSLKEARKIILKQINALDIERLHLESVAKRPGSQTTNSKSSAVCENDKLKELDLDVPTHMTNSEEEDDDEDL